MNPWNVDNLNAFCFLNCPECLFKSKEEEKFAAHAVESHPQSQVFFKIASDVTLSEQNIAIKNITKESTETLTLPNQILETSCDNQDITFYIKVVDENVNPDVEASISTVQTSPQKSNQQLKVSQTPGAFQGLQSNRQVANTKVSQTPGTFQGLQKKTGQSVQALIDVLDQLSDAQYSCPICEKPFPTQQSVKDHSQEEHADKDGKIVCAPCSKGFDTLARYNIHYRLVHIKSEKKPCPICGKLISRKAISRHKAVVHGDKSEKVFKCDLCDFTTHHQRYIYDHKYNKHGQRPGE